MINNLTMNIKELRSVPGKLSRLTDLQIKEFETLCAEAGIPSHYKRSEKAFLLDHSLNKRPTCTICGDKEITSFNSSRGYGKYCSPQCFGKDKAVRRVIVGKINYHANAVKIKDTCLAKYGVDHPLKVAEISTRAIKTKRERYNGHTFTEEARSKLSRDCILRDKDLMKSKMMEKHGVEHPMYLDSTKEKIRATNLERYGVEHPLQCETVQEKIRATNLERYGVEHYFQVPSFKSWLA